MEILVVTGGIGSGKSEVCRILKEEYGCGVYDADSKVKELYGKHPDLMDQIEREFDADLRDKDGIFVPRRLADIIFSNPEALARLESILFPVLLEDFEAWSRVYMTERFVVFESATILEKPQLSGFGDRLIIVDAPFDMRLSRACSRNGSSESEVRARMQHQVLMNRISSGESYEKADSIIRNTGSLEQLRQLTLEAVGQIFEC